jgi:hypothetical protein
MLNRKAEPEKSARVTVLYSRIDLHLTVAKDIDQLEVQLPGAQIVLWDQWN